MFSMISSFYNLVEKIIYSRGNLKSNYKTHM